jgi:hypothetical protein
MVSLHNRIYVDENNLPNKQPAFCYYDPETHETFALDFAAAKAIKLSILHPKSTDIIESTK